MACNHSCSCELFPLMVMEPALNLWKINFCDGTFNNCARYQLSHNGKSVPVTLLPNGKQMAPRSRDEINTAAFFNAIKKDRVNIIKSMIKTGIAKLADKTSHGLSPLMAAAQGGNVEITTLLLDHGCNPWRKNLEDNTALDLATINGHEACMEVLLQKMKTTTSEDYQQLFAISADDNVTETKSNVVDIMKIFNTIG